MCKRIHLKTSLTFSDLRKLKVPCIYRMLSSPIKNQFYLEFISSSFTCRTRNYPINQMIFFLSTDPCVDFFF